MNYLSKLIDWHKAQIGTKETGKNINKYADDMAKNYPDFLNGNKQGYDWCAVYQMDGFCNVYGMDNALKMLNLEKKNSAAGCTQLRNNFKAHNSYFSTGKVGDLIFFDWDRSGDADHVGFVLEVNGDAIVTAEGNSADMVKSNTYKIGDNRIAGYGRPNYDTDGENLIDATDTRTEYLRVLKNGCKGDDVRQLQIDLNNVYNAHLEVDGSFGPLTEIAVKNWQKDNGLQVDGCFGPASKAKMLELVSGKSTSNLNSEFKPYTVKVVPSIGVNLRTGASTSYAVLCGIPCGTKLIIKSEINGWGYTVYANKCGYVKLDNVKRV